MSIKDDRYYLEKIINDIQFVIDHTSNKSKQEISADLVLLDSIMFRLIQIAENNAKLTEHFKESHSSINWHAIRGMRNRIVHEYGSVSVDIVYDTVTNSLPTLLKELSNI